MTDSPGPTRVKQVLIVLAGLAAAGIMISLGVWQLGVYSAQGHQQAVQRAAAPPVDLTSVAKPGEEVGDGYGRTVRFTGRYDPDSQLLLPVAEQPQRHRVLTAFRLQSGGTVAVVRGQVDRAQAPEPPTGMLTQTGVLLPSQGRDPQAEPGADPTGVSLSWLAQRWGPDLVNGYVTLDPDLARGQSLQAAPLQLPAAPGRLRNGAYAMQWWLFAAFAVGMSIKMARDIGRDAAQPGGDARRDDPDPAQFAQSRATSEPRRSETGSGPD